MADQNDQSNSPKKPPRILAGLLKMAQKREEQLQAGRTIVSADERFELQSQKQKIAALARRGPGRPPKEKAVDLTSEQTDGKLQQKRQKVQQAAKTALEAMGTQKYHDWTDDDKRQALEALELMGGEVAKTIL